METDKNKITAASIKANIYDKIEIAIYMDGLTILDIQKIEQEMGDICPANDYTRSVTEMQREEIEEMEKRNQYSMSMVSKKRLLENESVLRFYSKGMTEIISISRLFLRIELNYKETHRLNKKFQLVQNIAIKIKDTIPYTEIKSITLFKRDSIICSSLYRMYQCLNKNMFGDISYELNRKIGKCESIALRNYSNFIYGSNNILVTREVQPGYLNEKECFKGTIDICIFMNIEDCKEFKFIQSNNLSLGCKEIQTIETILKTQNEIIFSVFLEHITASFKNDLLLGKTDKVLEEFNKNENE